MRFGTTFRVIAGLVLLAGCGGDGGAADTLAPIEGAAGDTGGTTATPPTLSMTTAGAVDAGAAAGFVSVTVQVASAGIDETLALDRASVPATALDPLNLDATCSALDGGDPVALSIIDLRRLAAGSRLVSAALHTEEPATAPGEHAGRLKIADAEQLTTDYEVAIQVTDGGRSGTFGGSDEGGNPISGSWVCADEPVAPPSTSIQPVPSEPEPDGTS
ncbi:MAG: hypothetical protein ACR2HP_04915 [Ilumatobacteraceae bacterium]